MTNTSSLVTVTDKITESDIVEMHYKMLQSISKDVCLCTVDPCIYLSILITLGNLIFSTIL
jgi:hypothetical protein